MRRRTMRGAVAPTVALLVLTLTGCGAGDGGAGADGADGGGAEVELGPLEEYYEKAYGEYDEDQAAREMRRVEEVVAECMAEQGFDYLPMDTSSMGMSMSSEELDVEWGTEEFAEQYGYGMTTNPYGDLEQPMPEEEFVDPNADYVAAMSESEAEAFYLALHGDQMAQMEAMEAGEEEFVYDWEQNGCQGRAQHEVYEGGGDEVASLQEEMVAVWDRTLEDPRMTEVTTAWVSCMGDAGITGLATVDDAMMRISEKVDVVHEEAYGDGSDVTEMPSEEDFAAIEAQVQERLDAITEEEITTAVADHRCRESSGYADVLETVSTELQQEFVDAHRTELEAWVEAVAAARS